MLKSKDHRYRRKDISYYYIFPVTNIPETKRCFYVNLKALTGRCLYDSGNVITNCIQTPINFLLQSGSVW